MGFSIQKTGGDRTYLDTDGNFARVILIVASREEAGRLASALNFNGPTVAVVECRDGDINTHLCSPSFYARFPTHNPNKEIISMNTFFVYVVKTNVDKEGKKTTEVIDQRIILATDANQAMRKAMKPEWNDVEVYQYNAIALVVAARL